MKKKMTIKITPEQKMRITTDEEMQMFLHMKRKGSSMTKNGKAYRRRDKHNKPNYQKAVFTMHIKVGDIVRYGGVNQRIMMRGQYR